MSPCPPRERLAQLLVGQLGEASVENIEQHLLECPECQKLTSAFSLDDTFVAEVRAAAQGQSPPAAEREQVERLIAGAPTHEPLADATQAIEPNADLIRELTARWRPAEGPGELGRLGGYRITRLLGAGGMGGVFQAVDPQLQRQVALKLMRPQVAAPDAAERFLREARAAAAVKHDNVVTIYQVGEDNGLAFIAQELLSGESLEARLARERQLSVEEAVAIGRQIAAGLAAAHARSLVHRDIKPANIWLEASDGGPPRVKLLDFGLARSWSDNAQLTRSGMIMGTPAYMAPEQASGEEVDARADLFSLGVVLYRMLTGTSPFARGNTIAILHALALDTPKPPREVNPQVPAELSALVMRLLEKKPERRPPIREVIASLTAMGSPSPAPAQEATGAGGGPPWGWIVGLAAAAAAILIVATIIVIDQEKYGTVTVDVQDHEKIRVVVRQNGQEVQVADAANGWTIRIREGKYELEMQGGPDDIKLAKDSIEVTRGNTTRAKIVRTQLPADPGPANPGTNPLPPVARREPYKLLGETTVELSPAALVPRPAKLAGVASWTFESRNHRTNLIAGGANPQKTLMAAADQDGVVRIWDMQAGRLKAVLPPRALVYANALAWSSEGKYLATRLSNDLIDIWDVGTGRRVRELGKAITPQPFKRAGLAWSPRRDLLAITGWGLSIHDFAANETRVVVPERCEGIAWSPDGTEAAIAFTAGEIRVYETTGWREQRTIGKEGHLDNITWSPRGDLLATHHSPWGGPQPSVRLWKAQESDVPLPELKWEKSRSTNELLEWSPAGDELWCASADDSAGFLVRFDLADGKQRKLHFPASQMGAWAASSLPQTKQLFLVSMTGVITRHKLDGETDPEILFDAEHSPRGWDGTRPSPDGQLLLRYAAAHGRGWQVQDLVLYDTSTTQLLGVQRESPVVAGMGAACWTQASDLVAAADSTDGIQVFDRKLTPRGKLGTVPPLVLKPRAWSADGKRLYATSGEKVFVWDWPKFRPSQNWTAEPGEVKVLAVSGDGKRIATAGAKDIHIWRADKLDAPEQTFPIPTVGELRPGITSLSWSPDHHRLLAGTWYAGAALIDVDSETMQNIGPAESIAAIGWDARRNIAMTFSNGGLVRNWDLTSLEARGTATLGDTGFDRLFQNYVSVLEGGATAYEGNRAYETETGLPYATFLFFNGARMVRFSPEGDFLGPAGIEKELVAVVKTDAGEYQTLSVEEFSKRYGWKNEATRAASPAAAVR
jgi:WD40 repeat protein